MALQERMYLDYAATAPLLPEVGLAMAEFLNSSQPSLAQYNANSLHFEGRSSFEAMESYRETISSIIGARPHELVFTSGATESDNAALYGIVGGHLVSGKTKSTHIVTTEIEHDAVYQAAKTLQALGLASVSFVQPRASGHIHAEDIVAAMREDTVLVSVMAVNNEMGAVMDIEGIGNAVKERGALFHTDMVQMLGKIPINLNELPVDAASFSAHKIGGPKGIGLLYLKPKTPFRAFAVGGGQEGGLRSGTQNVCGMAGFSAALQVVAAKENTITDESLRLMRLRDAFYERLLRNPRIQPSVSCEQGDTTYAPHIVNVCIKDAESESIILLLDEEGIAVSGGSACSSRSLTPSRILCSMGIARDTALGALRLSMGKETQEGDIDRFCESLDRVLAIL